MPSADLTIFILSVPILNLWWRHNTESGNRLAWFQHCPKLLHWLVW